MMIMIKDKASVWIAAFLDDRRKKVSVHGKQSDWCHVLESVLEPVLFTIFVSNVPGNMDNLTSMFTDDAKLYATLTDDINSSNALQEDLTKHLRWPMKIRMNFHSGKCHVLPLAHSKTHNSYNLNDDIYQQLKLSDHIENSVKKASRVRECLTRTFRNLNRDTFLQLYKATAKPPVEYALSVWCLHLKKDRYLISAAGKTTCAGNKGITIHVCI